MVDVKKIQRWSKEQNTGACTPSLRSNRDNKTSEEQTNILRQWQAGISAMK